MKIVAIIPARYASSRFPGKPLANLAGKPMILHVAERVNKIQELAEVWIATDDERIYRVVQDAGYQALMTSASAPSGTDRLAEAVRHLALESKDYIINVQGDEPLISSEHLNGLIRLLDGNTQLASIKKAIKDSEELFDPNVVKVICNEKESAIYFSRHSIPYLRGVNKEDWASRGLHYKHIGIYAYRKDVLLEISCLPPSRLEKAESLEQLRWLEAGYSIKMATTEMESIGVDVPEDIKKVEHLLSKPFH
jgi:3-deoxy-manno-octulosonate cytidylyltransferase (CMP-KDO synthetase)